MSRKRNSSTVATILLTTRALEDLREIESYSRSAWGEKTADKYLNDITAALVLISGSPAILHKEPAFSANLFFYRVRKHHLVCDYRDGKIVILTVIHVSMDIPNRLTELEPRLAAEVEFLHHRIQDR